ncbi:MAG TPA: response regulator [Bacteroidales bacterium]|nr:response regulator [Bacteroidales bacterium]
MTISCKILYVDDEPMNLLLFESMFDKTHTVFTAESPEEGLNMLRDDNFQVVVSDMKMPEMSGIEFIEVAKQNYPDIVYYILTGYHITQDIKNAIDRKLIKKYFQKPFSKAEIEKAIAQDVSD